MTRRLPGITHLLQLARTLDTQRHSSRRAADVCFVRAVTDSLVGEMPPAEFLGKVGLQRYRFFPVAG